MGHAFLHLRTARDVLNDASQLAEADNPAARNVGNVRHADERQQVVFAHAVETDVTHEHEFIIRLVKHLLQVLRSVGMQPAEQLGIHPRHPRRRLHQARALWVLADRSEDLADRALDAGQIDAGVGRFGHKLGFRHPRTP